MQRIGFLGPSATPPIADVFRKALADLGYAEGRNLVIETRWPDGDQLDKLTEAARTLVEHRADVLVVVGATAARAARSVTKELPIVFIIAIDPVATGLVASADKPDGNLTGTTTYDPQQAQRQLEALRQALPGLTRIALLSDTGAVPTLNQSNEKAAQALGPADIDRESRARQSGLRGGVRDREEGWRPSARRPVDAGHDGRTASASPNSRSGIACRRWRRATMPTPACC